MSKRTYSNCRYAIQDVPEMFCLFRKLHTQDGLFENCHCFLPKSFFQRITASPEVLAEKLVYHDEAHEIAFYVVIRGKEQKMGHECWRSTIIPGACWAEYAPAYAATVAKLREVCVEQNSVDYTQARLSKVDDTQKEVAE